MARKGKKRMHRMPPLSLGDKLIYWAIFLLLCGAYLVVLFGPLHLRNLIAFEDESVVAAVDHISVLWLVVPWMTFFLMTFILWYMPYKDRKPIFGKKNFKYGPPAWPKVYPLFMKNKPLVFVSERKKKDRKLIAITLMIVLLVSFIPFPWSLYGRDCLRDDGSIVQYNMFNTQIHEFASREIKDITIKTYRYTTGKYYKTRHWGISMVFTTDSGKEYVFRAREFRNDTGGDHLYWLATMSNIKKRYDPSIIRYEGVENLEKVIKNNWTNEEIEMLYQLFGLL